MLWIRPLDEFATDQRSSILDRPFDGRLRISFSGDPAIPIGLRPSHRFVRQSEDTTTIRFLLAADSTTFSESAVAIDTTNSTDSTTTIDWALASSVIAEAISGLPVWLHHGDKDLVFPVHISRDLNEALQAQGAEVYYSEYPETGHNSWDNAYTSDDFITWLFNKRRTLKSSPVE